jgi:hypothetical protein
MVLESLNLFDIFVNQVFGGLFLAYLGIMGILFAIGAVTRLSKTFLFYWLALYSLCMGIIVFGGLAAFVFLILSGTYFGFALYKWWHGGMT